MKKLLIINEDITQFDNVKLFLNRANACSFAVKYACTPLEGLAAYHLFLPERIVFINLSLPHSRRNVCIKTNAPSVSKRNRILSLLSRHIWMDFVQGITENCADAFLELPIFGIRFFCQCMNKLIS